MLFVRNIFMKNLFITKSRELRYMAYKSPAVAGPLHADTVCLGVSVQRSASDENIIRQSR